MNILLKYKDLSLKNLFSFSIFSNLIIIIISLILQFILPPEIPLFYGVPQTIEQLAPSILIVVPSVISFLLTLINILISSNLKNDYIIKTLAITSLSITILAMITTFKIIFLVGII